MFNSVRSIFERMPYAAVQGSPEVFAYEGEGMVRFFRSIPAPKGAPSAGFDRHPSGMCDGLPDALCRRSGFT